MHIRPCLGPTDPSALPQPIKHKFIILNTLSRLGSPASKLTGACNNASHPFTISPGTLIFEQHAPASVCSLPHGNIEVPCYDKTIAGTGVENTLRGRAAEELGGSVECEGQRARCCSINEVGLREVHPKSNIGNHVAQGRPHTISCFLTRFEGDCIQSEGYFESKGVQAKGVQDTVPRHCSYGYSLHVGVEIWDHTHNCGTHSLKTVGKPVPMLIPNH